MAATARHSQGRKTLIARAKIRQPDGHRERRAFTVDEFRKLLAVAKGEWCGLILASLYIGQGSAMPPRSSGNRSTSRAPRLP
ncbi:MAG: hypothetical protein ACKV19_18925 [Verrucomicrobiales bacterium]